MEANGILRKEAPKRSRKPPPTTMDRVLGICYLAFEWIEGMYPKAKQCQYQLADLLTMALAMFVFKYPSMYQYLHDTNREAKGVITTMIAAQRQRDQGTLRYRILRQQPLNSAHPDILVTVIQGERVYDKQVQVVGEGITTLTVTPATVAALVRYARQRWPIENEVFQTMKDQKGLNFEHNFGHGKAYLCDNLGMLMLVVALIDQFNVLLSPMVREVRGLSTHRGRLWERQRIYLCDRSVSGWHDFYTAMFGGLDPPVSS